MSEERRVGDRENMVSLHYHIDKLFCEYKESHAREHKLLAQAITLAQQNTQIHLQGLNEWRGQSQDERATFVSKEKFDGKVAELDKAIVLINSSVAELRTTETLVRRAHDAADVAKASADRALKNAEKAQVSANRTLVGVIVTAVVSLVLGLIAMFT